MRTMQAKQPDLREHSSEVAELAVAVARRLGMDGEEIDEIARAAELHDVGKVGIPDAILDKPAGSGRDRVGAHAPAHDPRRADPQRRAGAAPGRADRALHPRALGRHAAIPTGCAAPRSRWRRAIVAVCDAYEAMTTDRAYRAAIGHEAACQELRDMAGTPVRPAGRRRLPRRDRQARRARARGAGRAEAPVQLLADRVRSAARISQACAMPPISRGFHGRRRDDADASSPPTRPVPDARLPGPLGRPDAAHAARRVEPHHPRRRRRAGLVDVGRAARAAVRDLHRRHPLRDEVVQARHDVDRRLGRHAARGRRHRGRVRHRVVGRRLHDEPAARGRHATARRGSPTSTAASRSTPSTAARRGCSCRTCTSGRARSGCAAWR